jgi:hypothetical protein
VLFLVFSYGCVILIDHLHHLCVLPSVVLVAAVAQRNHFLQLLSASSKQLLIVSAPQFLFLLDLELLLFYAIGL